jgi:methanogenic corrinoid protein MtbC1
VLAIPAPDREELLHALNTSWFDIFALSVSADRDIDALQPTISEARKLSCNPGLGVMVGGALFMRQPALAETVGADGMSDDAPGALLLAGQLLKRQHAVKFN